MYLLPEHVHAALLEYLSGRPYREVYQGVAALAALEKAPEPQPEPAPLAAVPAPKE